MYIKQHTQRVTSRKETILGTKDRFGSLDLIAHPLGQAALLFSCLIHNYDHPGVPNKQLVKEGAPMALMYKKKSVAEQNALEKAWGLLMDPSYEALRSYLFTTQEELSSFRQLVVNAMMATDASDHELKITREQRWRSAFSPNDDPSAQGSVEGDDKICRASFVFELLSQAADACHTLQDWTIYEKWNRLQLKELSKAFSTGRIGSDPMDGWYESQLQFFDRHVIPLATRLRDCKIYGTSSDEFLDRAYVNRAEWKSKGRRIIEETKWQLGSAPKDKPIRSSSRVLAGRRKYSKSAMKLPLPSVSEDATDSSCEFGTGGLSSGHTSNSFMSSCSSLSAATGESFGGGGGGSHASASSDTPPSMPLRRSSSFPSESTTRDEEFVAVAPEQNENEEGSGEGGLSRNDESPSSSVASVRLAI